MKRNLSNKCTSKIIISDIIGMKSGMHYYHDAEYQLAMSKGQSCLVFSNYSSDFVNDYYPNVFKGNIAGRLLKLLISYIVFFKLCIRYRKTGLKHFWYGTWVDVPFIMIGSFFSRLTFDVHEIVMLDNQSGQLKKIVEWLFKRCRNSLIVHSEENLQRMRKIKDTRLESLNILLQPHPPLEPQKIFCEENIPTEYLICLSSWRKKKKLVGLFFGDLRPSKGIQHVLDITKAPPNKISVFVCGQDIFSILSDEKLNHETILCSARRQSDEELAFLFSSVDFVILPYKNSSQSGVLEVAASFNKPIIVSAEMALQVKTYKAPVKIIDFSKSISQIIFEIESFGNHLVECQGD